MPHFPLRRIFMTRGQDHYRRIKVAYKAFGTCGGAAVTLPPNCVSGVDPIARLLGFGYNVRYPYERITIVGHLKIGLKSAF